jgi:hypothetical protein
MVPSKEEFVIGMAQQRNDAAMRGVLNIPRREEFV